jgi:hypothetical protein
LTALNSGNQHHLAHKIHAAKNRPEDFPGRF